MMSEMKVRILTDGKIQVVTEGPIQLEHHLDAEEFLNFIAAKAGGERTTEKLRESHTHLHDEDHQHERQ